MFFDEFRPFYLWTLFIQINRQYLTSMMIKFHNLADKWNATCDKFSTSWKLVCVVSSQTRLWLWKIKQNHDGHDILFINSRRGGFPYIVYIYNHSLGIAVASLIGQRRDSCTYIPYLPIYFLHLRLASGVCACKCKRGIILCRLDRNSKGDER